MNKATQEYVDYIARAERLVMASPDNKASYYASLCGALQAMLGMEIERRTGEAVDYNATRRRP